MGDTRVLAFYLPQFHRVAENDAWWGEGFTEWTAVRRSKALFLGHEQPRIPLRDNYYDLLDKRTMQWQAELAGEYGVGGFCFYHYYFKDGRRILEKPAENLLRWKDIGLPFCFCWANESWIPSWSNVYGGNAWAPQFESERIFEEGNVLLEQKYGGPREWEEHFLYLLPFFQDERYIKADGKPVFVFYKPQLIGCLDEMLGVWERMAREHGFPGIYAVGNVGAAGSFAGWDAVYVHSPSSEFLSLRNQKKYRCAESGIKLYRCEDIYDRVLSRFAAREEPGMLACTCVGFDSCPRHGRNGSVITGTSPERFRRHLRELMGISRRRGLPFLFLNAWNEWGEGMYLEPDTRWGYGYLEAVRDVCGEEALPDGPEPDGEEACRRLREENRDLRKMEANFRENFYLLDVWMRLRENGVHLADYFLKRGYRSVAIYGYGLLGRHLSWELRLDGVEVAYVIDREKKKDPDIRTVTPQEELGPADVIVVTPAAEFPEIRRMLEQKCACPVWSLKEVIYESE